MEWKRRRFMPNLSRQFLTAPVIGIHLLIGHRQLAELHCTRGVSPMSTAYARRGSSLRNSSRGGISVLPRSPKVSPMDPRNMASLALQDGSCQVG